MEPDTLSPGEWAHVDSLVALYRHDMGLLRSFADSVRPWIEQAELRKLYHSYIWRLKDPEHLRDKLARKWQKAKRDGVVFDIDASNLFAKINDLVGFRLLHLHTSQFQSIHEALRAVLEEAQLPIIEGPIARVWDDEYRDYFTGIGVLTESTERMYTSVHYVIQANIRAKRTAEIQVRTLAEELWGEVDHSLNYPHPSPILACREQIKVLARVTSGCTRLVDAIFATKNEAEPPAPVAG